MAKSKKQRRKDKKAREARKSTPQAHHSELVHKHLPLVRPADVPKVSMDDPPELGQVETLEGIIKVSDRMVTLSHAKAFWYAGLPIFRGERGAGDKHTQFLFDQMRLKRFNWDNVIIATAEFEGRTYKINGQHTCWAVTFMPDNFMEQVREKRYRVKNEEQMRALYMTFDANKPRTAAHLTKVELTAIPGLDKVWGTTLQKVANAVLFWQFDGKHKRDRYGPAQVAQIIRDRYLDTVQRTALFYQIIHNESKDIRRQPVIAAMLATFDKVPTLADQFWKPVADGVALNTKNDPRWRLRQYLSEFALGNSKGSDRKSTDPESMYRACIVCWNKWRQGEELKTTPRATKSRVKPA